ncbi:hypothetical protein AGMMS50284_6930 [Clostridia bacterium]|nr:hypothetical protein AGMMS50284_6930 [Clostridia bacterium]
MAIIREYLIENTKIKVDDEFVRETPESVLRQVVTDTKTLLQRQSKEVQTIQENRLAMSET